MSRFICCLIMFVVSAPVKIDASPQSIRAVEWEVARGIQWLMLPLAPKDQIAGRAVLKIRISTDGTVTSATTQSGNRAIGAVAEPAVLTWRYNNFQYAGLPTEVDTKVTLVFEPSRNRYYVQGDHCVFYGPPGLRSNARDLTTSDDKAALSGRITVMPDNDPGWYERRVDTPDGVVAGKPTHRKQPPCPGEAQRAGVIGEVTIAVVVNSSGLVVYAAPIRGPGVFLSASVDAARQWEFTPTTEHDRPVIVQGSISFRFRRSS